MALRPTGKSLNPHFRTESLLHFNLNMINPKTSLLTPGQVDQTHFFTPSKNSPLCLSCSKKKNKNIHWLNVSVLLKLCALIRTRWNYTRLAKLCGLLQCQRQDSSIYLHSQVRPGAARFNHFTGKHRSKYEVPAGGELICTSCPASCSSFLAAKLNSYAISDLFALINMWMKGETAVC